MPILHFHAGIDLYFSYSLILTITYFSSIAILDSQN